MLALVCLNQRGEETPLVAFGVPVPAGCGIWGWLLGRSKVERSRWPRLQLPGCSVLGDPGGPAHLSGPEESSCLQH